MLRFQLQALCLLFRNTLLHFSEFFLCTCATLFQLTELALPRLRQLRREEPKVIARPDQHKIKMKKNIS
ncbi:hypothetical protein PF006_g13810 [Phytophthora fragariae]|uniref:Uncharacterized protein n=2 Tax=Phytophthora fragariae TaxID=53985 RepID=A0A6A3TKR7_9STRA|nr:hypothetical protein PF003_g7364 [Phytophthora fragariae]KAE9139147.1 hypothetical protein PF006_g13810 [Phytophthora fragariae]